MFGDIIVVMAGKILILGGGFGGIRAALDLEKKLKGKAEITLIDKNGYHLFVPALYEVASVYILKHDPFSVTLRKSVAVPYSDIFMDKSVNFVQAEARNIDLDARIVTTDSGNNFSFDYLVLALGSQVADFGIPGVREYAYKFKSVEDAILINRKVRELCDKASCGERQLPIKMFICGAGFSGIELAAEISLCARKTARSCGLKGKPAQVYLFEAMPQFLPQISDKERAVICKRLTKLGIVLMENSPIESVGDGHIKLKSGRQFTGDMVIWTAGIRASALLEDVRSLELNERGKIIVDEHLRVSGRKNIFAVGDNIEFIDHTTQKPIPSLAYLAIDHGAVAAQNIYNSIRNKELAHHRPFYETWIAPVGGKWALAHMFGLITVGGFMGWVMRELVDLRYFISILPFKKAVTLLFREIKIFSGND